MADRTAIVTGAGKRIGAEIARALIDEGWTVLAHVRSGTDSVPEGAIRVVADLSAEDCAQTVFRAAAGLPPVTLLVNNAARFAYDRLGDFSVSEFDSHMTVNVRAPLLLIEEFAARYVGGDALVANLLDAKLMAPNPDFLSYTLSKHTLASVTEVVARALAPRGIRVNGIAPSLILKSNGQSDENFRAMHSNNPLKRGVNPADVVDALFYLIGAKTVTGQVITIDSGQRFMGLARDVQFLGDE